MSVGSAGWRDNTAGEIIMFTYSIFLGAMGVIHQVPYNVSSMKKIINSETHSDRHLDLSDSSGFLLALEDILFLCAYPGNFSLLVQVDSQNQIAETHEGNNEIWLHQLIFNKHGCTGRFNLLK